MKKKKNRLILLAIFAALFVGGGATLWFTVSSSTSNGTSQERIVTAKVSRGDIQVLVSASGQVESKDRYALNPQISAGLVLKVKKLAVKEGDRVKAGESLMELDDFELRLNLEKAEASLKSAKSSYALAQTEAERTNDLYQSKAISKQEYQKQLLSLDNAYASMVQAQVNLELAKRDLASARVTSPIDGTVVKLPVKEMDNVDKSTQLAVVADIDSLYARVSVDEVDVGQVKGGQLVDLTSDPYPDVKFKGVVDKIAQEAVVKENIATYDTLIKITDSNRSQLRLGMRVDADIVVLRQENVLRVPNSAITEVRGRKYAEVVVSGKPERKRLEAGLSDEANTEVREGLQDGDEVVVQRVRAPAPAQQRRGFFGPVQVRG